MDDGEYRFIIRSRYDAGYEEAGGDSILFTIDAVKGPGLRFYPLHQTISAGSNVDMYLYVEDVLDLSGIELHLSYNPSFFTILEVSPVDLLSGAATFYKDLTYGEGEIRIIASGNNFVGINGTGAAAKFTFIPISSGLATVSILNSTQFRDSSNDPIEILVEKNGLVEVN